jgi:hypothetical protein
MIEQTLVCRRIAVIRRRRRRAPRNIRAASRVRDGLGLQSTSHGYGVGMWIV